MLMENFLGATNLVMGLSKSDVSQKWTDGVNWFFILVQIQES